MARKKKKRKASAAQLAALAKGRAKMASRRGGHKKKKRSHGSSLTPQVNRDTVRGTMAKRSRKRRSSAIVRHSSSPSRARKAARVVGGIAQENKHMTGALIGAAALGFAKKQGYEIPHIGTLGEAATLALAGYALDKFGIVKNRMLRHATTGFACIAVYEMASTGEIPGLGAKKAKVTGDHGYDVD